MSRISSGEMPPERRRFGRRPMKARKSPDWLAARMKEGEAARLAALPAVSYNRLTREEYVNTVRDLLAVQFDATDPGALLEDPSGTGLSGWGRSSPFAFGHRKVSICRRDHPVRGLPRKEIAAGRSDQSHSACSDRSPITACSARRARAAGQGALRDVAGRYIHRLGR